MLNARDRIGSHDVLLMTLDTLRFDVAEAAMAAGETPSFQALLPGGQWERRHTPASFTWAAHHAFFSGFLPTPIAPGPHPRLFAARFHGSETTTERTFVFDEPDLVTALSNMGYHTVCIGGVGFFNKRTPLGSVLPGMFAESHWTPDLGVTCPESTENQVQLAESCMRRVPRDQRMMMFINVSAMHQPNCHYVPGADVDSPITQRAALAYVDRCMSPLLSAMKQRGSWLCVICADHGTAYGESGFVGHRLAHQVVWDVPYAEFVLDASDRDSSETVG